MHVLQYARKTDIASVEIFSKDPISEMPSRLILLTMGQAPSFPATFTTRRRFFIDSRSTPLLRHGLPSAPSPSRISLYDQFREIISLSFRKCATSNDR